MPVARCEQERMRHKSKPRHRPRRRTRQHDSSTEARAGYPPRSPPRSPEACCYRRCTAPLVYPATPACDPVGRRSHLDFCGYIDTGTLRAYGVRHFTQRESITCFRCGEQGHYRVECLAWRTKMCLHHDRSYGCREGGNCSYAHSLAELRVPWYPRCVRVIKRDSGIITLGCRSHQHTFRSCPYIKSPLCSGKHWWCIEQIR